MRSLRFFPQVLLGLYYAASTCQAGKIKLRGIVPAPERDAPYAGPLDVKAAENTVGGDANDIIVGADATAVLNAGVIDAPRIEVRGTLRCPSSGNVEVRTKSITVFSGGQFICGDESEPISDFVDIVLQGSDADLTSRAFTVQSGGTLRIKGNAARSTRTRLSAVAEEGDTVLQLRVSVAGKWHSGDDIVLATTAFNRQPNVGQNERLEITGISVDGRSVTVTPALRFRHLGGNPFAYGTFRLDETAHVFNLRRNVRIRSDNAGGPNGGHVKLFRGSTALVSGAELGPHLGQAGRMGRYPFHWHLAGDVGHEQYLEKSSVHDSFQRCITLHGTQNAIVRDNTCFDFHGHGIFLEDGNEEGNRVEDNLVVLAKKAIPGLELLQSEHTVDVHTRVYTPAGIWVSNPKNDFVRNIVISSEGSAIWMAFEREKCCTEEGCLGGVNTWVLQQECRTNGGTVINTSRLNTGKFEHNVAASSVTGMVWKFGPIGPLVGNSRNPFGDRKLQTVIYMPSEVPMFTGNIIYKTSMRSIYFGSDQGIFEGSILADNPGSPLATSNQVFKNSLIVGWSPNAELEYFHLRVPGEITFIKRDQVTGLKLYDGPLVVLNCSVAGFPTVPVIRDGTVGHASVSYAPKFMRSIGAAARYGSVVHDLTFLDAKPDALYDFSRDRQSTHVSDVEGALTGIRGATVTGAGAFNFVDGCTDNAPGTFAITCTNYAVGMLEARNPTSPSAINYKAVRVPPGGTSSGSDPFVFTEDSRLLQVITSRGQEDFRYHIMRMGASFDYQMQYIFRHDEIDGLSPPLLFHYGDQCRGNAKFQVSLGTHALENCSGDGCITVDSEEQLASHIKAGQHAVFYDDANQIAGIRAAASTGRLRLGFYPGSGSLGQAIVKLTCADTFTPAPVAAEAVAVRGQVISVRMRHGRVFVQGWACEEGADGATQVRVETPDGDILHEAAQTNRAASAAIHRTCGIEDRSVNIWFWYHFPVPEGWSGDFVMKVLTSSGWHEFGKRSLLTLQGAVTFSDFIENLAQTVPTAEPDGLSTTEPAMVMYNISSDILPSISL